MKHQTLLQDAASQGFPVAFFGLFGKRDANGYAVSTGRNGFLQAARAEDVQGGVLWADIQKGGGEQKFLMEATYVDDKSYSSELAFETYACVLQKLLVVNVVRLSNGGP